MSTANKHKQIDRSPSYYVRQRMLRNKPAIVGMVVVIIAHLIALLGYSIMPDQTPDAADGAVQIQKQLPGFEALFIKKKKNLVVAQNGFFKKLIFGQETEYILTPVSEYKIEGIYVYYRPFKNVNTVTDWEKMPLISCMYNLNQENSKNLNEAGDSYVVENGEVKYLDADANVKTISLEQLKKEFEENNVERRKFLLGTDKLGRDILSKLMFGTRIALAIGFVSVLISLFLGVSLGAMAGFLGGNTDRFISWLMTVVWSVPAIMLIIAISIALQSKGIWVAFVAVGLTMWVEVARVVRGQILEIKEKNYIEAAKALGITDFNIILKHILPNIYGPIIVIANANYASAILLEAGLSFLGLGVQPPTPSWGNMVNEGFHSIGTNGGLYLVLFPSLCIMIMILAFNMFGNGLRDAYDPKATI